MSVIHNILGPIMQTGLTWPSRRRRPSVARLSIQYSTAKDRRRKSPMGQPDAKAPRLYTWAHLCEVWRVSILAKPHRSLSSLMCCDDLKIFSLAQFLP